MTAANRQPKDATIVLCDKDFANLQYDHRAPHRTGATKASCLLDQRSASGCMQYRASNSRTHPARFAFFLSQVGRATRKPLNTPCSLAQLSVSQRLGGAELGVGEEVRGGVGWDGVGARINYYPCLSIH